MTFDTLTIKEWRRRAGGLRHDSSLSERKIARIIAGEFGVSPEIARYHISVKDKRYPGRYDLKYKRLIRHIDNFLPEVFNGRSALPLKEISKGIDNMIGISLRERTLERILDKYKGKPRGPPIIKAESGNYRLNDLFYEN